MILFDLYLITDPSIRDLVEATRAALATAPPGRVAVQVRDKRASPSELASLARALAPACARAGAPLLINDRADVARAIGAAGVHLPENGLRVADARAVLGPDALIGSSCHDGEGMTRAETEGASFATLGPIREVPGKPAPIGVDGFHAARHGTSLPTYALGGVTSGDASALVAAGARGLAVIRAVHGASEPSAAVDELLDAIARARVLAASDERGIG